jgi:hypothetical protein
MGHDGWLALVGVVSVCRRSLSGENGLMRVLDTLEGVLPTHVRFKGRHFDHEIIEMLNRLPPELARLASLQSLNLSGCGQLTNISPLAGKVSFTGSSRDIF